MRESNPHAGQIVNDPDPEDLTADAIATAAQQPQSASVDGVTVSAVPIADQIKADQYRRTSAGLAGNGSAWGMTRTARVQPPGATG
jgi:hypothetical protein